MDIPLSFRQTPVAIYQVIINIFQLVFKDMNLQIAFIFSRRIELIPETNVTHSYKYV